jgi:hypothetical protein
MSFNTAQLVNDQVLVSGTDVSGNEGQVVVNGSQWAELNRRQDFDKAQKDFDQAVDDFFAPLLEAGEKAEAALNAQRPEDPIGFVVLDEGKDATPGTPRKVVTLTKDSQILRLIEDGHDDRLVWVRTGDHVSLEILAVLPGTGNTRSQVVPDSTVGAGDQS